MNEQERTRRTFRADFKSQMVELYYQGRIAQ